MKTLTQFAHGDVLFTMLSALPGDRRATGKLTRQLAQNGRYTFAVGEECPAR